MIIRNIGDLAEYLGAAEATNDSISRRVYKDTGCGAWMKVSYMQRYDGEVVVGSIVEGHDAEAPPVRVPLPCDGEEIDGAIEEVEAAVDHYLEHGTFL